MTMNFTELQKLYADLGTIKWDGSDAGWDAAILAVRGEILKRLDAAKAEGAHDELLTAGAALNALIETAQQRIAEYLEDASISQGELLGGLIGILDGPAQRDAQGLWKAAQSKAEGRA